ncbi:MAG: hypothetical protein WBK67_02270 [Minisyncoccales bacterium]|jgi:hypothetical protein
MNLNITKETVKTLIDQKGEARGIAFQTDEKFILFKKGAEKLGEIESQIGLLIDEDFKYDKIDASGFYPVGLRAVSILVIAESLDLDDSGIKDMGFLAPKTSMAIRLFTRYFLSIEKVFEKVAMIWSRHYTSGTLEPLEINHSENYLKLKLKDFNVHPVFCTYLSGYFKKIGEMATKDKVTIEEIECFFKEGKDHIFEIRW